MLTLQPHQWYLSDILVTFLYVFLMTCYIVWPLAPPRGMTLEQRYHTLKGVDVGKCHTKFQLLAPQQWYHSDILVTFCLFSWWTLVLPKGMTLGQQYQWYHTLKGLDAGKCHTKFQLSSPSPMIPKWYFSHFLYVFLVTCYIFWPLAPPKGMILGQWYHTLKGLDVGKCHTKFQLSSPEGIEVISCKRNADVNLHIP